MGVPGFPSQRELLSMFGYVTDEDRAKWEQMRAASDKELEQSLNGMTARGMASQSISPAVEMIERSINAQMTSASMEERRNTQRKQTKRTVTTLETEEPIRSDEHGFGF